MPTYEYVCEACGYQFEREQRMSEDPIKKCPECKKSKARRMISGGTGFMLKGAGWYKDLYSKPPESTSPAPNGSEATGSAEAPPVLPEVPAAKPVDAKEPAAKESKVSSKPVAKSPSKKTAKK